MADRAEVFIKAVRAGDVIQLDPAQSHGWGPLLCIVDEVKPWGLRCHALVPEERGAAPAQMHMRVDHGGYVVIGHAEWIPADPGGSHG